MRRAWDAFAGLALLFSAAGALSQGFPSKPVRIVVPFPPGGGADTLARIMEPKLAGIWAQAIVVENRPGASGHIGADFVARSAPDGHTLLMSSTASLTEKNVDQFSPVSLVSASPYVVTANPKVAAADIRGLIALAKARPGKLSFGSSGTGAASHLSAELFKSMARDERGARENAGPRRRARGQHPRAVRALHTQRPGEVVQADERGGDYAGLKSVKPPVGGLRRWLWRRSGAARMGCSDG